MSELDTVPTSGAQNDSRCLGWMCNIREFCQRHMSEHDVVLRQWFIPHHPGDNCDYFIEYFDGEE